MKCDISDLESVRDLAASLTAPSMPPVDVIVANAGCRMLEHATNKEVRIRNTQQAYSNAEGSAQKQDLVRFSIGGQRVSPSPELRYFRCVAALEAVLRRFAVLVSAECSTAYGDLLSVALHKKLSLVVKRAGRLSYCSFAECHAAND